MVKQENGAGMAQDIVTEEAMENVLQPLLLEYVAMVDDRFGEFGSKGKFLFRLIEMDDHSFVINTHNLIEHFVKRAAVTQGLDSSIKNFERCGNKKRMDALLDSGYLPEYGYQLLLSFSRMRNDFAHEAQHTAQTFHGYLDSLDEESQRDLIFSFVNAFFNSVMGQLPDDAKNAVVDMVRESVDQIPPEAIKLCLISPILILAITTSSAKEHERTYPLLGKFFSLAVLKAIQDIESGDLEVSEYLTESAEGGSKSK